MRNCVYAATFDDLEMLASWANCLPGEVVSLSHTSVVTHGADVYFTAVAVVREGPPEAHERALSEPDDLDRMGHLGASSTWR